MLYLRILFCKVWQQLVRAPRRYYSAKFGSNWSAHHGDTILHSLAAIGPRATDIILQSLAAISPRATEILFCTVWQ